MPTVQLTDRAIILVAGADAESLLQNVITTDLSALQEGEIRPGALLTPQGKILFDFLISRRGSDTFRLDCRKEVANDLSKRLMLYRLRAKAEISVLNESVIITSWSNDSSSSDSDSIASQTKSTGSQADSGLIDRRFPEGLNVRRHYDATVQENAGVEDWRRLRIAHGVAESGADYALGDTFPHDVLFDQNGGVGLKKGCYVGQEVVSRMQHRGTARRRLVLVRAEEQLPSPGTALTANARPLGQLGSVDGMDGLAIVRIDRVADARAGEVPILAGDVPVELRAPAYAQFPLGAPGNEDGSS